MKVYNVVSKEVSVPSMSTVNNQEKGVRWAKDYEL